MPNLPDLKLDQGGLMLLLKAVRVLCNAWALCGADLVEHPTEKSEGGSPKKVRNIHLSQAQRYHGFLFEGSLEIGPGKKGVVSWVVDRDRKTRNQARTVYLEGLLRGECLASCIENHSRLIWEISGVGTQSRVSLVRRTNPEDEEESEELPKRGGNSGGGSGSKGRPANAKRAFEGPKVDRRLQTDIDKSCPGHNSKEGCTKRQADCPHNNWRCCSQCGRRGHSASNCRIAG